MAITLRKKADGGVVPPLSAIKRPTPPPVPVTPTSIYTEIIGAADRSKPVLIIGKSGSGKSTAIGGLPPAETFLVNVIGKDLPIRGWRKNYTAWRRGNGGNMLASDQYTEIEIALDEVKNRREIKYIVIDDFQYLMANEFMRRSYEKGFEKFTDIGRHAWDILWKVNSLGTGKFVFILAHSDINDVGETDVKTIGKMLSEKVVVAGLFTIVLQCVQEKGIYYFLTRDTTGKSVVKSPPGVFGSDLIYNNLKTVADAISAYEG